MSWVRNMKSYLCYQCSRTVSVSVCPSSDPSCPYCNDGFLEECESPNPSSSTLIDLHNPSLFSHPPLRVSEFDPFSFLQSRLQSLSADHGGASIQLFIENHPSRRLPSNFGDYLLGPGLEQLMQHLADTDPNRYGTPPAAKSAVQGLPTLRVSEDHLASEMNQCAVCQDEFQVGTEVKLLPCNHLYHQDCILPWLHLHSSCPVCRYELPTDPQNERRVNAAAGGGNIGDESETGIMTQGEGQGSERDGDVERTVRITFPWPFLGGFGSGSGSDSDGNNWDLE